MASTLLEFRPRPAARNQAHANMHRVAAALARAGIAAEVDHGASDEGDPWVAFVQPDGDVIAHVAVIDGQVVADSPAFTAPMRTRDIEALLERMIARLRAAGLAPAWPAGSVQVLVLVAVAVAALKMAEPHDGPLVPAVVAEFADSIGALPALMVVQAVIEVAKQAPEIIADAVFQGVMGHAAPEAALQVEQAPAPVVHHEVKPAQAPAVEAISAPMHVDAPQVVMPAKHLVLLPSDDTIQLPARAAPAPAPAQEIAAKAPAAVQAVAEPVAHKVLTGDELLVALIEADRSKAFMEPGGLTLYVAEMAGTEIYSSHDGGLITLVGTGPGVTTYWVD